METPNATRANAALWAHYIDERYSRTLSPLGGVLASGLLGIGIANLYAAMWGNFIGSLFAGNAPQVTKFTQENVPDVLPVWPATPLPSPMHDQVPPWLRTGFDDVARRERERREETALVGAA